MTTVHRINTMMGAVENVLREVPITRNDDAALTIEYCRRFGGDELELNGAISRCRRRFNQMGKYWPTDEKVAKARRLNMEVWYEWAKMQPTVDKSVDNW